MNIIEINEKVKDVYGSGSYNHIQLSRIQTYITLNYKRVENKEFDMNLYTACNIIDEYTLPEVLKVKIVNGSYIEHKELLAEFGVQFKPKKLYFLESYLVEDMLFKRSIMHHSLSPEFVTDRLNYLLSDDNNQLLAICLDAECDRPLTTCIINHDKKLIFIEEEVIKDSLVYLLKDMYRKYKIIDRDFEYETPSPKVKKGGFVFV